jgi:hypothetical protein
MAYRQCRPIRTPIARMPAGGVSPAARLVQDIRVKCVQGGVRKNDPAGKSPGRFLAPSVQPLLKKYSDFQKYQISSIWSPFRAHKRGASRSSRTLGAGCGGRGSAPDERHGRGRRSRVVLTPRRWRQVGGKISRRRWWQESPVTKESAKETVNHRAGKAGLLPLNLYARVRYSCTILHARPRVQRAPGFPCAL